MGPCLTPAGLSDERMESAKARGGHWTVAEGFGYIPAYLAASS